jgi:hypothetical protein
VTSNGGSPTPAPLLTALSQATSKWALGSELAQLARKSKPPVGTTFRFTLNTSASVRFSFAHCARRKRHHKSCARTVTDGALTLQGHAGADLVRFAGKLSAQRSLRPRRYTMSVTATNAAGRSATHTLSFTTVTHLSGWAQAPTRRPRMRGRAGAACGPGSQI